MSLELVEGSACFSFPYVDVTEEWQITGGTGRFSAASGDTVRSLRGDVRTGAATGTWSGVIILD